MATFGYVEHQVPFCDPFLCFVVDQNATDMDYVSHVMLWDCVPLSCRRKVEIFLAIIVILSVLTTWFNVIVLAANLLKKTRRLLGRNPTMQNYSNYVISLALADLVMGLLVMPLAAICFYKEAYTPRVAPRLNATIFESSSISNYALNLIYSEKFHHLNNTQNIFAAAAENMSHEIHPGHPAFRSNTVLHLLGFFTHASIFVSVYTLAASSADRFYVSTKPNKNNGIRLSR